MQLVELHRVYQNDKYYSMLDDYCFKAKNLYNNALYHIRQYYIYCRNIEDGKPIENLDVPEDVKTYMQSKGKYIDYYSMDKLCKKLNSSLTEDYKSLPIAVCSQGVLKKLHQNWISFFEALKVYNSEPDSFLGRPSIPGYLDKKNGRYNLVLTNQVCKIKDGIVTFPKSFNGFTVKTNVEKLQQVTITAKSRYYQIEIAYNVKEEPLKEENNKYLSVDIGVTNLAAITNNFNDEQWIISGKPLKSKNQYYNKLLAYYKGKAKKENKKDTSKHIQSITRNRNDYIETYMHKASKMLINLALSYDVSKIVIGYNQGWKQEVDLGDKTNQNFVSIPFNNFINKLKYKGLLYGIEVVTVEESYTSGTSFLDGEMPNKENYNKSRRVHRGLFKSNSGRTLNSDVNGSYQILKKYIGNYKVNPTSLKVLQVI